ncbi:MAG: thiamine-binding protein [Actinomycetota bacterium]|nr:thiamine-binding protein [Actinomycetota bacterium]
MVEPFREAAPGPHVQAALDAARDSGLELQFGPFATTVVGEESQVLSSLKPIIEAALRAGATRVSLQVQPGEIDL